MMGGRKIATLSLLGASFKDLARLVDETGVLLLDGGTGEELLRRGMPDDRETWSARAISDPQYHSLLKNVHRSFLNAGARAISTNSYGITQHVGFSQEDVLKHCHTAARLAREVVEERNDVTEKAFVLGSLGPLGESYRPDLIWPHDKGVDEYTKVADVMNEYVDAFIAETMSCVEESMQVSLAVKRGVAVKPLFVSFTLNSEGTLRSGELSVSALNRLLDFTSKHSVQVLAILFNCSEPEAITRALSSIHGDSILRKRLVQRGIVLGAYANRLTAIPSDWTLAGSEEAQAMRSDLDPQQYYRDFVLHWVRDLQVRLVGGCCGMTPEHIKSLHDGLSNH